MNESPLLLTVGEEIDARMNLVKREEFIGIG
jgi:hypothetical protein